MANGQQFDSNFTYYSVSGWWLQRVDVLDKM